MYGIQYTSPMKMAKHAFTVQPDTHSFGRPAAISARILSRHPSSRSDSMLSLSVSAAMWQRCTHATMKQ